MQSSRLPDGLEHVRTTDVFDETTVPRGLLRAHRVAEGVWGHLVVHTGAVTFVFDDDPDHPIAVAAGGAVVIPPGREHHLVLAGPMTGAVEFHRMSGAAERRAGTESSGLHPRPESDPGHEIHRGA